MLFGAVISRLVFTAAELRLADHLAAGDRSSAELAARTGAHPRSLQRLLRALAGIGVVAQTEPDGFELTPLGAPLRADAPDSIRNLVLTLCGEEHWRSWDELPASLRTGESGWERAHGLSWVDYYERHPKSSAIFNAAMSEHTRDAAAGLIAAAGLGRFDSVMDVGGGDGTLLAEALRAHSGLEGVLLDLPEGLVDATATLEAAGVATRCTLVAGDFFDSVPAGADAYLLKHVLHDWDDEAARHILGNVAAAAPEGGRVLIAEHVLEEVVAEADRPALLVDMLMLVVTGGRERTEREFRVLCGDAGLELTGVSAPAPPFGYRVLEAIVT
jgi:O-methyltransferase domain/Dimerisation domain